MYRYVCKKCFEEFDSRKKGQLFCSKSCANSFNTAKRKILDKSIFQDGINDVTAYILGLILSDGCMSYDKHSKRYRITISMNEFDIIKFLRDSYCPDKKIYKYKNPKGREVTYTFISTNEFDISFLKQLGITERKSLKVKMPIIETKYLCHLIRGIFDGDGSVYKNQTTTRNKGIIKRYEYINASFTTGSYEFAKSIKMILEENKVKCSIVRDSRTDNKSWYVKIYSKESIRNLKKFMYTNAKLFLDRKKIKFEMMR